MLVEINQSSKQQAALQQGWLGTSETFRGSKDNCKHSLLSIAVAQRYVLFSFLGTGGNQPVEQAAGGAPAGAGAGGGAAQRGGPAVRGAEGHARDVAAAGAQRVGRPDGLERSPAVEEPHVSLLLLLCLQGFVLFFVLKLVFAVTVICSSTVLPNAWRNLIACNAFPLGGGTPCTRVFDCSDFQIIFDLNFCLLI